MIIERSLDDSDGFSSQDSEKKRMKASLLYRKKKMRKQKMDFLLQMIGGDENGE